MNSFSLVTPGACPAVPSLASSSRHRFLHRRTLTCIVRESAVGTCITHTHTIHTHAQVIMHLLLVSVGKCVLFSYLMPTLAVVIVPCPTKVFVFPCHKSNHYVDRHAIASYLPDRVATQLSINFANLAMVLL